MPFYDYVCPSCKSEFSKLCKSEESKSQVCDCGTTAEREFPTPSINGAGLPGRDLRYYGKNGYANSMAENNVPRSRK